MPQELTINTLREAYENPQTVARYSSETGLWKSETFLIQRYFPKRGKILDLGCGTGRTSIPLAIMGFHVIGMDLSYSMVEIARLETLKRDLKVDFLQMDASALACKDEAFDGALFSFNGIDQMPGLKGKLPVLRQIYRVLKPGAYFIFCAHRVWSTYHLKALVMSGLRLGLGKIFRFDTLEKEWGEIYNLKTSILEERYLHFMSTRKWKLALFAAGFDHIESYSRSELDDHWWIRRIRTRLSSWNYALFAARKPS